MRSFMQIIKENTGQSIFDLSGTAQAEAVERFQALARSQRNGPAEMLATSQRANPGLFNGTGYFTWMCEHIGDLTHRIADNPLNSRCGFNVMTEKVTKALAKLRGGGFGLTFAEMVESNVRGNFDYSVEKGETDDFDVFVAAWKDGSRKFRDAHAALLPLNDAQRHCRDAAVALGDHQWDACRRHLEALEEHLGDDTDWMAYAGVITVSLNENFYDRVPQRYDSKPAYMVPYEDNEEASDQGPFPVWENPSRNTFKRIIENGHGAARGLIFDDGRVMIWDQRDLYHSDVGAAIQNGEYIPMQFFTDQASCKCYDVDEKDYHGKDEALIRAALRRYYPADFRLTEFNWL